MQTRSILRQISSTLTAIDNCINSKNGTWLERHRITLDGLAKELPKGSGFDIGTKIDEKSSRNKIILNTAFHFMDENGFYDGWEDYQIIVTPDLLYGFNIKIKGKDRQDIKDYIAEEFHYVLSKEI